MYNFLQFIKTQPCEATKVNLWVTAESPARIDLAGGWSDTPPITYEHGGAVTNAALYVDGKVRHDYFININKISPHFLIFIVFLILHYFCNGLCSFVNVL